MLVHIIGNLWPKCENNWLIPSKLKKLEAFKNHHSQPNFRPFWKSMTELGISTSFKDISTKLKLINLWDKIWYQNDHKVISYWVIWITRINFQKIWALGNPLQKNVVFSRFQNCWAWAAVCPLGTKLVNSFGKKWC